mmetsp:Transcript_44595/g.43243  ORF Transcript_44595/g.43243 Transcript_44595/m.43243 type:complete len:97 (-) Transcript_44595:399-689(-)
MRYYPILLLLLVVQRILLQVLTHEVLDDFCALVDILVAFVTREVIDQGGCHHFKVVGNMVLLLFQLGEQVLLLLKVGQCVDLVELRLGKVHHKRKV